MSTRALDAAGIREPDLREAYDLCRRGQARSGGLGLLATGLLPEAKRPYVWALDGFARHAAALLEDPQDGPEALRAWGAGLLGALSGDTTDDPVVRATVHTLRRWQIARGNLESYLDALRAHAAADGYPYYPELERYLFGAGAAPALLLLPVLEPLTPEAAPRARALGEALRLTTLIQNIGADLQRGRVWLPEEDLADFAVSVEDLRAGEVTGAVRELLRFELDRAGRLFGFAEPGIEMLHPTSRDAVRTVLQLAHRGLAEIERSGYRVLTGTVKVPWRGRVAVTVPRGRHARTVRREQNRWVQVQ